MPWHGLSYLYCNSFYITRKKNYKTSCLVVCILVCVQFWKPSILSIQLSQNKLSFLLYRKPWGMWLGAVLCRYSLSRVFGRCCTDMDTIMLDTLSYQDTNSLNIKFYILTVAKLTFLWLLLQSQYHRNFCQFLLQDNSHPQVYMYLSIVTLHALFHSWPGKL